MRIHRSSGSPTGGDEDIIACSLEKTKLADSNPFYALSYVWGSEAHLAPILLEGQTVYVRKNLWLFLHAIRNRFCGPTNDTLSHNRTIRVWADYISINQIDLPERNYQVSMMGEIYQAADAVYAWLGESPSPYDDGMQFIKEIKAMQAQNIPLAHIYDEQSSVSRLRNIASSAYWTRLWIKQEVLLAKDVWFFFGQDVANWEDVRFAADLRQENPKDSQRWHLSSDVGSEQHSTPLTNSEQAMTSLLNSRASYSSEVGLQELVTRFSDAGCQDARDRIYALLSLIDSETRQQIVVDYEKPLFQILLENYPHWTNEQLTSTNIPELAMQAPSYEFEEFNSQIATLLSTEELDLICHSETARHAVNAQGIFTTWVLSEIASVSTIATMDSTNVRPLSDMEKLDSGSRGFVMRIVVRAPFSGRLDYRFEFFTYANIMPGSGDLLAHIGMHVLFFRKSYAHSQSVTSEEGQKLILLGTGTDILSKSSTANNDGRLCTQYLRHPCHWVHQQLPDASFELVNPESKAIGKPKSSRKYRGGVEILCNAAAMATLLLESRLSEMTSSIVLRGGKTEYKDHIDETDVDARRSDLWFPYAFGMQHKILDPCVACKTDENNTSNPCPPQHNSYRQQDCECKWISSDVGADV